MKSQGPRCLCPVPVLCFVAREVGFAREVGSSRASIHSAILWVRGSISKHSDTRGPCRKYPEILDGTARAIRFFWGKRRPLEGSRPFATFER